MCGFVCNDLMVEIFERLPPKSIIRFRSLSKYWHDRLLSPEFLHDHRLRCSKNPPKVLIKHVFCCPRGTKYEFKDIYTLQSGDQLPLDIPACEYLGTPGVEFPYRSHTRSSRIVGSYNGILCLHEQDNISLWNLSIRRRLIIPHHPFKSSVDVTLGFGFDPITDDYNIVVISYDDDNLDFDEHKTFIYSLKTKSWSVVPSPSSKFSIVWPRKACFFNGILHWVVFGYVTTERTTQNPSFFILTFNLSSHVFSHIVLPEPWYIEQLTTINGCLAVVSSGVCIRVWTMKEYGNTESWSVLFELKSEAECGSVVFLRPVTNGDLLAYCKGEVNVLAFYERSKVYNPQRSLFTKFLGFEPRCYKIGIDSYVESLELVDKEGATTCGKTVYSWTNED